MANHFLEIGFSFVVGIEFFCILWCQSSHFKVADGEALFFDGVEDSADFQIAIRFDESECSEYEEKILSLLFFEPAPGVFVSEVNNFELPRVDIEDGADEDIFELYGRILGFFKEHPFIFEIVLDYGRSTISMVESLM